MFIFFTSRIALEESSKFHLSTATCSSQKLASVRRTGSSSEKGCEPLHCPGLSSSKPGLLSLPLADWIKSSWHEKNRMLWGFLICSACFWGISLIFLFVLKKSFLLKSDVQPLSPAVIVPVQITIVPPACRLALQRKRAHKGSLLRQVTFRLERPAV